MNHLCQDIDTLYNTKGDKNVLNDEYSTSQLSLNKFLSHYSSNASLSNASMLIKTAYNLNNSDHKEIDVIDQFKKQMQDTNFNTKCCCVYSDLMNVFDLETPIRNDQNNEADDRITYYDDKYSQTNIDHFLSTSISTSTSNSTSLYTNSSKNNSRFYRKKFFLANTYSKKSNGLYLLTTSMISANKANCKNGNNSKRASLHYCNLTQKRRLAKRVLVA
jgi:hypothetical protein